MSPVDDPRFEFRVWSPADEIRARLRSRGRHTGRSVARDCYVLAFQPGVNAKIRGDDLEIKHLIDRQAGLQRWRPAWESRAPFAPEVTDRLFAEFGLEAPSSTSSRSISVDRLVAELRRHDHLDAAWVTKDREFFDVGDVSAEVTELTIDDHGVRLSTIAIEATDPDAVIAERRELEMEGMENIAVHRAVREAVKGRGDGD